MIIKQRIKELRRVPAKDLQPSPWNWRIHPSNQRTALQGLLKEIGFAGASLVRELPDGSLELIDGHLRAETMGEEIIPALVTDLNEEEAKKLIATFDPLAGLAQIDDIKIEELLQSVSFYDDSIGNILPSIEEETKLKPIPIHKPPKLAWVLIGIPVVRFGEISLAVEELSRIHDIIIETTVTDEKT